MPLLAIWDWPTFLNNPNTLALMIPITCIVVFGIVRIAKMLIHHRERMAMIERGMHPDYPPEPIDPPRVP